MAGWLRPVRVSRRGKPNQPFPVNGVHLCVSPPARVVGWVDTSLPRRCARARRGGRLRRGAGGRVCKRSLTHTHTHTRSQATHLLRNHHPATVSRRVLPLARGADGRRVCVGGRRVGSRGVEGDCARVGGRCVNTRAAASECGDVVRRRTHSRPRTTAWRGCLAVQQHITAAAGAHAQESGRPQVRGPPVCLCRRQAPARTAAHRTTPLLLLLPLPRVP